MPTQYQMVLRGPPFNSSFPENEAVLSDGGIWLSNPGADWTNVSAAGAGTYGTQTGSGGFDDSVAVLAGSNFGPNVESTITIARGSTSGIQEVEILLRCSYSAGVTNLYEINLAQDGSYLNVYRWPGPLGTSSGQFTQLAGFTTPSPATGHQLRARIVGNVITVWYDAGSGFVLKGTATDTDGPGGGAVNTTGQPGIGFYREAASGAADQFRITALTVTQL